MADFLHSGWGIFVAVSTLASIAFSFWIAFVLSKKRAPGDKIETTGHVWDETLAEYNNPLPRWWLYLFYFTCAFGLAYVLLYPGLGAVNGQLGWSSVGEYEEEVANAKAVYEPLFARYLQQDVPTVAADPQARAMGERLFLTYCVQCHGSDARGSKGFPNLADRDWLWGGEPAAVKTTIMEGRISVMPPMGAALNNDPQEIERVANYVLSLSGSAPDPIKAAQGKEKFLSCTPCHGPEGGGQQAMGAPNLTDKIWLHGGSLTSVMETISQGHNNRMPSFKHLLGEGKGHVLTAYVWGLSNATPPSPEPAK